MTIRRILKQVKDKHLIETGNYNKLKIDRTKWYRIDYERLKTLSPFGKSYRMQEVNITQPIPKSNITETKSNITIDQNSDEFVVERISPNNNIFSRLTDTYGADDVKSVLDIVNQYIDEIYKSKTGREHDKISKKHRMTFVEKLLDFKNDTDTGQEDLIRLLNYMIENMNVKDPTIYWLTSPTVLGYWYLPFFGDVGYQDLRGTKYMPVEGYY